MRKTLVPGVIVLMSVSVAWLTFERVPPESETTGTRLVSRSITVVDGHAQLDIEKESVTIPGTEVSFTVAMIPGGTFVMGSPAEEPGRDGDEGPRRQVTLGPFWIGTHEVSFDEFAIFRFRDRDSDAALGSSFDVDAVSRPSPPYEDPSHGLSKEGLPATGMTQWAALQYARWLSAKTGDFYRLPTEAEWEYACRAGSSTAYSFGDEPSELADFAWFYENGGEVLHRSGGKQPNAWGLFDFHGNVAEWTLDQYDPEYFQSTADKTVSPWISPRSRHPRTVRGGAFDDDAEDLRCAARLKSSLNWKRRDPQIPKSKWWNTDSQFLGFRLVREAKAPPPGDIEAFWNVVLK